jgi:hypothetical protein
MSQENLKGLERVSARLTFKNDRAFSHGLVQTVYSTFNTE